MSDVQRSMKLLRKAERMCGCQSIAQASTAEKWLLLAREQEYLPSYIADEIERMARGIVNGAIVALRGRGPHSLRRCEKTGIALVVG